MDRHMGHWRLIGGYLALECRGPVASVYRTIATQRIGRAGG
jgi:hypothetical protein